MNSSCVLVTGGRDYEDREAVFRALDTLSQANPYMTILHGACCAKGRPTELRGADRWAQEWAQTREMPYIGVPARWATFGDDAGRQRNFEMLETYQPTSIVVFPGNVGTEHLHKAAKLRGIPVWEPEAPKLEKAAPPVPRMRRPLSNPKQGRML
jgi:hypothetical protein